MRRAEAFNQPLNSPHITPYTALPSDTRIFDPAKVREVGLDFRVAPSAPLDDPATIRRELRKRAHDRDN